MSSAQKWASSVRYMLVLIPVSLLTLKIKYSILTFRAIEVISRSIGGIGNAGLDVLGIWDKLSLFGGDILISFIVFPICCLLITKTFPRRFRAFVIAIPNIIIFFMLFATWKCHMETGRYYSVSTFLDSISWALQNPRATSDYVTNRAVVQIALTIVYICGMSVWAALLDKRDRGQPNPNRIKYGAGGYLALILIIALPPSLVSHLPSTPYHKSVLIAATEAFWEIGGESLPMKEYASLERDELLKRYSDFVHAPRPERNAEFWGKAKGFNVLFFILETAPTRVLRIDGDLQDLPVLRRLREKAFIGLLHQTTYPYSSRAWFSIFSSLYPSALLRSFGEKPGLTVPSIMRLLSNLGYNAKVYYTALGNDYSVFESLGIKFQYLQGRMDEYKKTMNEKDVVQLQIAEDMAALSSLKKDIEKWSKEGRRFCVAVGPQIGHGPWPDLPGVGKRSDLIGRGRSTIVLQDKWLGELMSFLEQHNQLDKTIIVVTGDHGVRTRQEDPRFEGGMIDEYSFHVPLLIYAPGVLHSTVAIPWVTSHIDISPTLLELLGISEGRSLEQGSPIWNSQLQDRVTYFFANHFLGADGYTFRGTYYMRSQVANQVYKNGELKFSPNNVVPLNSPEHKEIADNIRHMVALQEALGKTLRDPHPK